MKFKLRNKCAVISGIFVMVFVLPVFAQQDAYDQAVSKADSLVREGQFVQALGIAQDAIRLDPTRFKAYYYAAYALYVQDLLERAAPLAKDALGRATREDRARATDEDRALAQKLVDAIANKKVFIEQVKIADDSIQQGLIAKAAAAYTKAWDVMPVNEGIGLKAAQIWSERLNKPGESARILNYLVEHPQDAGILKQAGDMLQRLGPALQNFYKERMQRGQQHLYANELEAARKTFNEAAQAMPKQEEPHLQLARVNAKQIEMSGFVPREATLEKAIKELAEAIKLGWTSVDDILKTSDFNTLLSNARFLSFIGDALGSDAVDKVRKRTAEREATRQKALDEAETQRIREEAARKAEAEDEERARRDPAHGRFEGFVKSLIFKDAKDCSVTLILKNDNDGKLLGKLQGSAGCYNSENYVHGTYANGKIMMDFGAGIWTGTLKGDKIIIKDDIKQSMMEFRKIQPPARISSSSSSNVNSPSLSNVRDPISGIWYCSADMAGTAVSFELNFKLTGSAITGTAESDAGPATIAKGLFSGDKLSFSLQMPNGEITFTGILRDNNILGDFEFLAFGMSGKWEAKRKIRTP
jgi:hypothetical protein